MFIIFVHQNAHVLSKLVKEKIMYINQADLLFLLPSVLYQVVQHNFKFKNPNPHTFVLFVYWGVEVVKASLDLTGKILILIKED